MIIGFDASRAFVGKRTGTENYSYQLLLRLAEIDRKNTYHIFLRPVASQGCTLRGWPSNFKPITLPYPRLWTQVGLAKQTFIDKLDVLFVPAHTLPLIRRPHLPTVVTVHDLGAEYLPSTHQLKQRLYLKLMTHYQLKSATRLIAVSEATKDDLIKKVGIASKKISVIYEGFNNELFKPTKVDLKNYLLKQFDLVPDQYFLFVGTIQPRKNLERLIRAYAKFLKSDDRKLKENDLSSTIYPQKTIFYPLSSTVKLVIAGSKGWLSEEIYQLPKKLGIENQVRFLGYVPDKDLPTLYSGALAFVFPSLFEGFGLPILEAMAVGCPVLTSNISSLPEVAGKAALLVNPYSEDEIAQNLIKLYTNSNLLQQLTTAGFEQIKKFSWEKCARETLAVLGKVTAK